MVCTTVTVSGANMVTIQIKTVGNGQVWSSSGSNLLAVRNSITVPAGATIYLSAVPSQGETFINWTSPTDPNLTSTVNPTNILASVDGTIIGNFTGTTKDNTMMYVGAGLLLLLGLSMMKKK